MSAQEDPAPGGARPGPPPRRPTLTTVWGWALFALVCYGLSGVALALHWIGPAAPASPSVQSQYVLAYNDLRLLQAKAQEVCAARHAGDAASAAVHELEYGNLIAAYDSAYRRALDTAGSAPHDLPASAPGLDSELATLPCR